MAQQPPAGRSNPREVHEPVGFPTRAAIGRKGLLPTGGSRRDARPEETDTHWPTLVLVLAMKGADATGKLAGEGWKGPSWIATVEPVNRPAASGRIVDPEGHSMVAPARKADVALFDMAEAREHLPGGAGAVELDPVMATGQSAHEVAMTAFPDTDEEVEVRAGLRTAAEHVEHVESPSGDR